MSPWVVNGVKQNESGLITHIYNSATKWKSCNNKEAPIIHMKINNAVTWTAMNWLFEELSEYERAIIKYQYPCGDKCTISLNYSTTVGSIDRFTLSPMIESKAPNSNNITRDIRIQKRGDKAFNVIYNEHVVTVIIDSHSNAIIKNSDETLTKGLVNSNLTITIVDPDPVQANDIVSILSFLTNELNCECTVMHLKPPVLYRPSGKRHDVQLPRQPQGKK